LSISVNFENQKAREFFFQLIYPFNLWMIIL